MWWFLLFIYVVVALGIIIYSGYQRGYHELKMYGSTNDFLDIAFVAIAWPALVFCAIGMVLFILPMMFVSFAVKNIPKIGSWIRYKTDKDV